MPELVVLADQLFAPVPGGTGRYTAELLRALAETAPAGWSVTSVVSRRDDLEQAEIPGVDGPRVLPVPRRTLVAMWQAGIPYWPGGDAVHAPTPLAPPRRPAVGRHRRATLAVTVHDSVPWTHPHTLTRRGVSWHRIMVSRAMRRADFVVVPTRSVAAELREHVPGDTRVEVVAHGVSEVFTAAEEVELPVDVTHLDLPDRYVLCVGTLEPRKGLEVLIDAIARLHQVDPRAPALLLVGQQGWGWVDPTTEAQRYGLPSGTVRVLGRLPDLELAAVMRRAAVLAAPSHAEGFGLPVLEAMAAGVPVVHSDVPAVVEVAGGAGVTVPRGDAQQLSESLQEVVNDPVWSAKLAAAGRRRAAEFSWRSAAEAVWSLHRNGYRDCPGDVPSTA
ncbi:glycosyltransferase family 1 protein [Haloechinothrix sp. LS1_15]|uniref:glycosyltransferase family 4 protein n=1 Tax=Haloechinothrix sp. LS1_15 TaxID=2652248 RepID=UPI0029489843|nr:glycosyltransferase family 1 protein [Haloechinothrix sp. LS1_15]MDV6013917.1 glycosyltransferase family 4 protein [Haloechinothrix sp. LS1_15]